MDNGENLEKKSNKNFRKLKKLEEKSMKKAKGFLSDFKQFATKGNVIDMAVGVIIANAFTKIVNSLVNDIITPVITIFTGKIDYTNLFIALDGKDYSTLQEATNAGISVICYGSFITNVLNFLMIAFWLFVFLKIVFKINNIKKKEQVVEQVATTKKCKYCFSEIAIEATRCSHCTSMLDDTKQE